MTSLVAAAVFACLALGSGGCGYQWRSTYREDIRTVAVPTFENKTYNHGIEIALTRAIAQQLESHSPYKIVPRERADTVLEGEVTQIVMKDLSRDINTNIPKEQQWTMAVDFRWTDQRTGQNIVERRNFLVQTTYYPQLGEGEFVASQQAVDHVALQIVQELEAEW